MAHTLRAAMFGVVAAIVSGCTAQTPASAPQFTAADETEVRSLFDSTVARINRGDWTAWSSIFADSAIFHAPNAKAVYGRPAILAWGQSFPPIESLSFSDVQVWGEGNLAYGTSAIALKIKDAPADTSKQLAVFRRSPSGPWEVVAGSFSSDLPVPVPAPARR